MAPVSINPALARMAPAHSRQGRARPFAPSAVGIWARLTGGAPGWETSAGAGADSHSGGAGSAQLSWLGEHQGEGPPPGEPGGGFQGSPCQPPPPAAHPARQAPALTSGPRGSSAKPGWGSGAEKGPGTPVASRRRLPIPPATSAGRALMAQGPERGDGLGPAGPWSSLRDTRGPGRLSPGSPVRSPRPAPRAPPAQPRGARTRPGDRN
ncbi:tropomodulin-2-like [Platysternon megacephalum]|uniref:Tropomodulin-2-like n=1 Tax=Platysternon megacephalum TaxID=55544 RepID=A0A4D9EAX1_9SAUR|nr:tropomodulin-2-like [Platysternon megacephalum]